jgi:hypothetical protein
VADPHVDVKMRSAATAGRGLRLTCLGLCTALLACLFPGRPAAAQGCDPAPGTYPDATFVALLQSCAGQKITFAAGTYRFTPSGYERGFEVAAGTTLQGNGSRGPAATVFEIADSGVYQALLWVHNVSNVVVADIDFEDIDAADGGHSYPSGCPNLYYGVAIYLLSDSVSAGVQTVSIQGNTFHDFNGSSWINMLAGDGSAGIGTLGEIALTGNVFISDSLMNGGCAATQGQLAYMVWIQGSVNEPDSGLVENVSIGDNHFHASYVEGAIALWDNTRQISIQYNNVYGAGDKLPAAVAPTATTGPKRYAILLYTLAYLSQGKGRAPDTIWMIGNVITNPESCGIYAVSSTNLAIQSNIVSGQIDKFDGTEPKAGIGLSESTTMPGYPLAGNQLSGNYVGLAIVLGSQGGMVQTGSNSVSVPANSFGVKLTLEPGSTDTLSLQGLNVSTASHTNATSLVGYGSPAGAAFVGLAQNGWTTSGSANRGLSWCASPANCTWYSTFSQVPQIVFGNANDPITADGVRQAAFWHP